MIFGSNVQKVYLGNQEISKIFLQGTEIFSSIQTDPYSDYVTLLTHFNTDFSDSSTNNLTLSALGNTFIDAAIPRFGAGCVRLDGNGDYLQIEDNEAFGFGTGDFTIEAWVFPQTLIFGDFNPIIDLRTGPGSNGLVISVNSNGNITVNNPGGSQTSTTSVNIIQNETWNYLVVQRKNSVWQIYINGFLDPSTMVGGNNLESSRPCYIGTFANTFGPTARYFRGLLDDIRITKGIARYTESFDPPTSEFPNPSDPYINNVSLLLHMDGTNSSQTFIDSSNNNFALSVFGNTQTSTSIKKFGSGAAYFDGTGDYLEIADNDAFELQGNDFTIECWFRINTLKGYQAIASKSYSTSDQNGWMLYIENNNKLHFIVGNSSWSVTLDSNFIPTINTWYHVTTTREGNIWRLFVDGDLKATTTNSVVMNTGNLPLYIGWYPYFPGSTPTQGFHGYIDDFRFTKGVARYTSNFVPQTAPFANPLSPFPTTGLLAFYSFQNNILDSVGTISPLLSGNLCSFNYTTGLNGTNAIQFNNFGTCGFGGGLFCPNDVWNIFQGNTKASFAFWFKYTQNIPLINPINSGCGMTFFGSDFGRFGFGVAPNNGTINRVHYYIAANSSGTYVDPSPITVGEWNHVAGTYDNTTRNFRIYRNGNLVHNYIFPFAINAPTQDPNIFKGFGINGSGYIVGGSVGEYGVPIVIDSLGLWTRVLTDQDVSVLYNNGLGREL